MNERKNLINQMRAILLERGITFPVGRRKFEQGIDARLADEDTTLSLRLRQLTDHCVPIGANSMPGSRL